MTTLSTRTVTAGIYLEQMVNAIPDDSLPEAWTSFELSHFSQGKYLFDYQQKALQNASKVLWKYYENFSDYHPQETGDANRRRKHLLWQWYQDNGLLEDFSIEPKSTFSDLLLEHHAGYTDAQTGRIAYEAFVNRMSFWMATGSGKTLVIVKLIELLGRLVLAGEVPPCDILFLTHRDDLIGQLKRHVEEFNTGYGDFRIILREMKEYAVVKRAGSRLHEQALTVFCYRSDNLSDEQKEKMIDFRNYDNEGRWFVLLDEAHKGDREDSKRQHICSILSRNGFLFNFSATFTDPRDIATTVFNFNLSEYIRRGYGKHLLVLQQEMCAFKDSSEPGSNEEAQGMILPSLILLTYVRKVYEEQVRPIAQVYHRPLLLVLVNSVNPQDADLERFFRELERIAREGMEEHLWQQAKDRLGQELGSSPAFLFEDDKATIDRLRWENLSFADLWRYVFNAPDGGAIEVLLRPSNRQEVAFKLKTSDRPFALIKIGDISPWIKEKLKGYEVIERFEDEDCFTQLNTDNSDITILMGSRSFYEGWDSNRPNVLCYINIGTGIDARKFILQSVGRGVRIEPIRNRRRRLLPLYQAGEVEQERFEQLRDVVQPLETLFIFGTNRRALQTVIGNLQQENTAAGQHTRSLPEVNPEARRQPLLIPAYSPGSPRPATPHRGIRLEVEASEFQALQSFVQETDPRVLLALTEASPAQIQALRQAVLHHQDAFFSFNGRRYGDLKRMLRRVVDYLGVPTAGTERLTEMEANIGATVSLD